MVNGMCTRARQGGVELQISPTKAPILECRRRPVQRLVGERRRRNHRAVGFARLRRGRSGLGDLDKDGSLEVVINHLDKRRSLPKNFVTKKNWLLIQCVGTTANRDGDRTSVYVHAGSRYISGEIQTGSSFLSPNDPRGHGWSVQRHELSAD
jgi:hypothetical protein